MEDVQIFSPSTLVKIFTSLVVYYIAIEILRLMPKLNFFDVVNSLESLEEQSQINISIFRGFVKTVSLIFEQYVKNVITEILQKAKESKLPNNANDLHHIVSKSDVNAFFGRFILALVNIDKEDNVNKVLINHRLHMYVNRNAYNWAVGLYLGEIYKCSEESKKRERVYNGLLLLKVIFMAASEIVFTE